MPPEHLDYIGHFTGISDPFEIPQNPDLILTTHTQTIEASVQALVDFIVYKIDLMKSEYNQNSER